NKRDLKKIETIRADFFSALPEIRALCERALLENLQDKGIFQHLLSGMAAADGLLSLALLLTFGRDGCFKCNACDSKNDYVLFGDQIAIYAESDAPRADDRKLQDYKERAPSRADGFMVPLSNNESLDPRVTALLLFSNRAVNPEPALLLRNFLGTFHCSK